MLKRRCLISSNVPSQCSITSLRRWQHEWLVYNTPQSRAYSLCANIHKEIYIHIVWPDRCVPQIKTHDRVCARGNNEVHKKMDPLAANSYACWKFCACRSRVLSKGDAWNCWLASLSVSGLRVSSLSTVHCLIITSIPFIIRRIVGKLLRFLPLFSSYWTNATKDVSSIKVC